MQLQRDLFLLLAVSFLSFAAPVSSSAELHGSMMDIPELRVRSHSSMFDIPILKTRPAVHGVNTTTTTNVTVVR